MNKLIVLTTILLYFTGCESKPDVIKPFDYTKYFNEFRQGRALTAKDINLVSSKIKEKIRINTVGKKLPNIIVKNPEGHNKELKHLINGKTLLLLGYAHCASGMEGQTVNIPNILKKLKINNVEVNTVVLLIKDSSDYKAPESYNSFFIKLKAIYPNLYSMNEIESKKFNNFCAQGSIPKQDLARLSNTGGEMIASLDAESDFSRKLLRRINSN